MKTTTYIIGLVLFSAVMLSPKEPKFYPPKEVLEQRKDTAEMEVKLNQIITEIAEVEAEMVADSLLVDKKE